MPPSSSTERHSISSGSREALAYEVDDAHVHLTNYVQEGEASDWARR
jgi:hypothetical protein